MEFPLVAELIYFFSKLQVNKKSLVKSQEVVDNLVGAAASGQSGKEVLCFSDNVAAYVE